MNANLLKYSNGWGHLLISLSTQLVAVFLFAHGDTGIASGLLISVTGYWFVTSAANAQKHTEKIDLAETPTLILPVVKKPTGEDHGSNK